MREVNPQAQPPTIDVHAILNYLKEFIKNPVHGMTKLPDWNWPSLFFVQITFSVISGVLAGLIKFNFYRVAYGLILMPIVSTVCALLLTTFFYYYFQFFENRTENFKKIFNFVILASVPFYIFQLASEYMAAISIIGFGFTSLLAIVGLTENFQIDRRRSYQIAIFLFTLVLVTWVLNHIV